MGFKIVLITLITMIFYMSFGFLLVKGKKAESSHAKSLSGLLIYVLGPCMIINAFQKMGYSIFNFKMSLLFFFTTLGIQVLFFILLFVIFRKKFENPSYRMLVLGGLFGNVGFFGMPIISSLFPSASIVSCYSVFYTSSMNIIAFTIGVYLITKDKKYMSLKDAIINPTGIAVLIAIPLYLLHIVIPDSIMIVIELLGKMTAPICMVILGMRLASMNLKTVFSQPFAYGVSVIKLIIFPIFAYLIANMLPFADYPFRISILVLSATPTAAILLSLAELHECEQERSANAILISTIFCVLTMPILVFIFTNLV